MRLARRHGVFQSAAGSANWPIATYCPFLGPFPAIGGGANRPLYAVCPSSPSLASFPLYFPFLSLDKLCQRSPWAFSVSLLCVMSTQRRATALAVGQAHPSGHPILAVENPSPTAAFGPQDVHLWGQFPDRGT